MSRIHFIGGEKGGVGKSVVARLLAQWFVDKSLPFAAVDGERSQGALLRYYRDFTQPADLAATDSADQIIDRALGADRRVLVDLPAQSARALEAWMTGANVIGFASEMGIGLTYWHVCDGGFASVGQIDRALREFGTELEHVVVKNYGRSKDFTQFDESDAKRRLDELSGRVIELPELDPATMYRIDKLSLSFWAAAHRAEGDDVLKPLERQRVKLWLERCYAQFEALNGTL
jgi:hypothetical protein